MCNNALNDKINARVWKTRMAYLDDYHKRLIVKDNKTEFNFFKVHKCKKRK